MHTYRIKYFPKVFDGEDKESSVLETHDARQFGKDLSYVLTSDHIQCGVVHIDGEFAFEFESRR